MSWKVHLAALSVAIIVILIIANIPTGNGGPSTSSPLSIHISSASWGLNCQGQGSDPYKFSSTNSNAKDNVLNTVSRLCNEKVLCDGYASSSTLGADPFPGCSKDLEIEYRCFSYDRPWKLRVNQEQAFTIDCKKHYPS